MLLHHKFVGNLGQNIAIDAELVLSVEGCSNEMLLLFTEQKVGAQWHFDDLLLVGDQHDEGILAEVRHKDRHDPLCAPLCCLLLRSLEF